MADARTSDVALHSAGFHLGWASALVFAPMAAIPVVCAALFCLEGFWGGDVDSTLWAFLVLTAVLTIPIGLVAYGALGICMALVFAFVAPARREKALGPLVALVALGVASWLGQLPDSGGWHAGASLLVAVAGGAAATWLCARALIRAGSRLP